MPRIQNIRWKNREGWYIVNKSDALKYVKENCTKMGLCEYLSEFYIKCPKNIFWDYNLVKKIFKYEPLKQVGDIYHVFIETNQFEEKYLDIMYEYGCEIVENNYIDKIYEFKITNNLIHLLKEYFDIVPDEYQMGESLEDKIVYELGSILKRAEYGNNNSN